MDLFQKIAEHKTTYLQKIDEADRIALEPIGKNIENVLKEYDNYIAHFKTLPVFQGDQLNKAGSEGMEEWSKVVLAEKQTVVRREVRIIKNYLNHKYTLNVDFDESEGFKTLEEVLSAYFRAGNIIDLVSSGEEKVKKEFVDMYNSRWDKWGYKTSAKSITLVGTFYLDNYSWSNNSFSHGSETKIRKVIKAMNLFEFGTVGEHNEFAQALGVDSRYLVEGKQELVTSEKIVSTQCYQNGNIKLTFANKETLNSFVKFFKFDRIEAPTN